MKMTSTCVAAALLAWMSSGAAWACDYSPCDNTAPPPQAEERIATCESGQCNTATQPEAVIACETGRCNTDTPPEAVIACVDSCNNTDTQPQTDAKPA